MSNKDFYGLDSLTGFIDGLSLAAAGRVLDAKEVMLQATVSQPSGDAFDNLVRDVKAGVVKEKPQETLTDLFYKALNAGAQTEPDPTEELTDIGTWSAIEKTLDWLKNYG